MKIAFIFPPFDHKKFEEDIGVVSREFTQPPPLGLAYAAAIAQKAGHQAIIIDANCQPRLSKQKVLRRINSFKPDMLGFMLTVYMFRQTLDWIKFLKQHTDLAIIVGNVLLELYPKEVMMHKEIEYGIIGSAQQSLPELLLAIEQKMDIAGIKGVCYKRGGEVFINPPDTLKEDFDTLPFPARQLLPNHKYYTVMSKRKNFTIMITSKGCPSKCGFCHVKNIPYSARKAEGVVDEIEQCFRKFNIREIEFFDPVFTFDKKRVIEICKAIRKKRIDVSWTCRARVDQIDEELLNEMKSAGCTRIYYGVESGNQNILNNASKGITLEKIRRIVSLTKKKRILTLGFFLIGAPGDTIDTIKDTISFASELNLDYAQFHKTIAKPTTILYDLVKRITGRDYWREYILGTADEERLPTPWTDVSDKVIERYTIKAYRKFYFRPSRLTKISFGIKSFGEFKRYVKSAVGLCMVKSDLKNS